MRRVTAHELIRDKKLPKLDDGSFRKLLGEMMPKLELNSVGRHRLVTALRLKFGDNFRTIRAASDALAEFESQHQLMRDYIRMKGER